MIPNALIIYMRFFSEKRRLYFRNMKTIFGTRLVLKNSRKKC